MGCRSLFRSELRSTFPIKMGNCTGKVATAVQERDVDEEKNAHLTIDELFALLQEADATSMLKKHLSKEIFEKLKDKKTNHPRLSQIRFIGRFQTPKAKFYI